MLQLPSHSFYGRAAGAGGRRRPPAAGRRPLRQFRTEECIACRRARTRRLPSALLRRPPQRLGRALPLPPATVAYLAQVLDEVPRSEACWIK
jgi:hypothetical protein